MGTVVNQSKELWVVAHGPDALHFVKVHANQICESGQPNVEVFPDREDAVARCLEIDPEWVDPQA